MYNPNDPVGKVTETMAKLFAVMADEIIREMGNEKGRLSSRGQSGALPI